MFKRFLLFACLLVSYGTTQAQLTVASGYNAAQLAESLVGAGVVMLNPTLSGQCPSEGGGAGAGKFTYSGSASLIGIDSGIVLTSGNLATIPSGAPVFASAQYVGGAAGDPDLTALINVNTPGGTIPSRDACVLSFDFVPKGDTVKFDYVFASEEYNGPHGNFNCSINDVFGFFISGPGYATPTNIALIPGTNVMVGVSTVNDGVGSAPTNACGINTFGAGPYTTLYNQNAASTNFVYSGYTDVFTAVASVVPCDTYHLKLAIADASDQSWDSGVFLKAGSLNSTGIKLTPESTEGGNDDVAHCIRGCKSGHIRFARPAPRSTPLTIKYLIAGTAVNGIDYQTITDSITIPANQTSAELEIKPLLVQYPSGTKEVIIRALSPYSCGNGTANIIDSAILYIYDSLYVNIPTPLVTVCPMTEVTITADIDPTLNFSWSPAALIPDPLPLGLTIHPKPSVPTTYTITVSQPGAPITCPTVSRSYLVNVEPIPQIKLTKDSTICLADSIDIGVRALPSNINYTWNWSPSTYLRDNFSANNKFFAPVGDYKYVVTATTPIAGCSSKDSMMIHVVPPFDFISVTPTDTTIKYGDQIQLSSESEAIFWLWDPVTYLSDPLAREPYATPLESMIYTLVGMNQYGCKDTAEVKINVEYASNSGMPNAFTPNGDGLNDIFKVQNLRFDKMTEFRVFNRWGRQVFSTTVPTEGWDGTINGEPAAADVYYYTVKLVLPGGVQKNIKGDITLLR